MKYLTCPPCGSVLEGKTEEELIRVTQAHAKQKHGYEAPRDEILRAMTSERPKTSQR
jgi:predicted small metal-binding protein